MCYLADDMDWDEDISAGILINGEITYGLIDEDLAREIAAVHAEVLVDCYIDQTVLSKAAELGGKNIGTYLKEHILPDEPRIISGDSGEVLARSVLQEWGDQPSIPNYRWRNKEHKNAPVQGTDIIGFVYSGNESSDSDMLYMCEVKTRANSVSETVVKDAFEGVKKDYASRLAESLEFAKIHLIRDGKEELAEQFARFCDAHETPFHKRLVACVVHDEESWDDEFLHTLPDKHGTQEEVLVLVLRMPNLWDWMHYVHKKAVEMGE